MLFKSINLKSLILLFLWSLSLGNLYSQPTTPGNPFGNPPIIKDDGDPGDYCGVLNGTPYYFTVTLENVDLGFPCNLHVGITNPNGSIQYVQLTQDMFVPDYSLLSGSNQTTNGPLYSTAVISGGVLSYEELLEHDCIQGNHLEGYANISFILNFYCFNGNNFEPLDYCENYEEFSPFLGSWYGPQDCDLTSTITKRFCCNHFDVKPQGIKSNKDGSLDNNGFELTSISNNEIHISINSIVTSSNFIVRNISGQIVNFELISSVGNPNIILKTYNTGIYFVSYISEGNIITKKVFLR